MYMMGTLYYSFNSHSFSKMKKLIFIPITLILLTSCSFFSKGTSNTEQTGSTMTQEGIEHAQTGQTTEERIEESKRRVNFRAMIRKGDYLSLKNDREAALRSYLSAYVRLKDDNVLERKIANAYFDLKEFSNAYKYYKRVPFVDLDEKEKKQTLQSIMFDETISMKNAEIKKLGLSHNELSYYWYIENCYTGIHNCVVALQAYTGSFAEIKKLKDITYSYEKVSADFQYRNALLAGALFESEQYLAGMKIAREITEKRPDYIIALKIAGYSAYELGRYREANTYLARYYTFESKDTKIAYILGLTNYYLEDYITSNLYFNTAVLGGYTPKTELERRLVYNYYILNDRKAMFKIFRYLLEEPDVTEDDFIIAVHIAKEDNNRAKAFLWANRGIEKFTDSDMLLSLRSSLYLNTNNLDRAETDLQRAYAINPRNPFTLLQYAKLHFAKNDYTSAKGFIKNVLEADPNSIFAEEAKKLTTDINKKEQEILATAS